MAMSQSAVSGLFEVFRTGEGTDFIRECVRVAKQHPIKTEATAAVRPSRNERADTRRAENRIKSHAAALTAIRCNSSDARLATRRRTRRTHRRPEFGCSFKVPTGRFSRTPTGPDPEPVGARAIARCRSRAA